MNWLWAYFRRKVAESILAGVHDALASADGITGLTDEDAAKTLRAIAGAGGPVSQPAAALPPPPPPPPLTAPGSNGPSAVTEPPRRGLGHPRKFQEPPEPQG